MGFRGAGVDGDDPGVGVGAAQDGAVQHAGQVEVVDVVTLPADEAGVLFAGHTPEAERVAGRAAGDVGGGGFGGSHELTSR